MEILSIGGDFEVINANLLKSSQQRN